MEDKTVSIIIVTWNNLEYTKLCIDSIEKYTNHPYKLIFVDNGSKDGTVNYLKNVKYSEVVLNKKNMGYGKAVNRGVTRIKTDYFLLLNNDIIVSRNWLSDLIRIINENPEIEQLTTNSNTIIDKDKAFKGVSFDSWMDYEQTHRSSRGPKKLFESYYGDYDEFVEKNKEKNIDLLESHDSPPWFLGGWCLLMKKSILPKIGGFLYDERFKMAFWEDVDLSWRVGLARGKLAVAREIYLHHFINTSANKLKGKAYEYSNRNKLIFMEKWEEFIVKDLTEKSRKNKDELIKFVSENSWYKKFFEYYGFKALTRDWS